MAKGTPKRRRVRGGQYHRMYFDELPDDALVEIYEHPNTKWHQRRAAETIIRQRRLQGFDWMYDDGRLDTELSERLKR